MEDNMDIRGTGKNPLNRVSFFEIFKKRVCGPKKWPLEGRIFEIQVQKQSYENLKNRINKK